MNRHFLVAALLLGLTSACANMQTPPNVDRSSLVATSGADEALERIALIRELIYFGSKDKNPLALVTAARMTRALPTFEGREPKKLVASPTTTIVISQVYDNSVDGMLKRARQFAGRDRRVLAEIEVVAALPKAKPGGTAYMHALNSKVSDEYEISHKAGERAVIYIEAQEEDQYLQLTVLDDLGNVVCQGDRQRAQTRCAWTPLRDGKFKFRITNPLGESVQYVLFTN